MSLMLLRIITFQFKRSTHLYHRILLNKNDIDAKKITVFIAFRFMQEKSRNFHVLKLFLQKTFSRNSLDINQIQKGKNGRLTVLVFPLQINTHNSKRLPRTIGKRKKQKCCVFGELCFMHFNYNIVHSILTTPHP